MAQQVRAFDWSQTPLGAMDSWPDALRLTVNICLASRFPMFVWWGPELIKIYNDGYLPMLGKRDPAALGRPARGPKTASARSAPASNFIWPSPSSPPS